MACKLSLFYTHLLQASSFFITALKFSIFFHTNTLQDFRFEEIERTMLFTFLDKMGHNMSKKSEPSTITTVFNNKQRYMVDLNSYEDACRVDNDLISFDNNLQSRTNRVITTLADEAEIRSLSFDSFRQVTECLLEMNQEVVRVILECKKDIWKNRELFELVEEYFENSLQTLDFCTALERCLKHARDSQLLVSIALQVFDEKRDEHEDGDMYVDTLNELKAFKAAGDPFTEELVEIFQSVYLHQSAMLEKLRLKQMKLDKKLKYVHSWRKVSSMIFAATFAAIMIVSVVAAAVAAPPVAAALAAASSVPFGSMGKWINSLLKNYENAVKGEKEVIGSMQVGTHIAIKDLSNIRVLIDKVEIQIGSLLGAADFAINEKAVRIGIEEIRKKLDEFMKNVEELGLHADMCSRDVRRARTVILQRIIKPQNH
ncbi:UPF0496 protein At4g34320-like [Impatiens glandulifera]|uniref:UPF0496 protein At4g34320-like n=1 Tax=Impatiens glandulifera TaxID=253017 RepID=UPI001FB06EF3|nr:UPF0496 protein At4g34320-like [Impatiens glandulifera]